MADGVSGNHSVIVHLDAYMEKKAAYEQEVQELWLQQDYAIIQGTRFPGETTNITSIYLLFTNFTFHITYIKT